MYKKIIALLLIIIIASFLRLYKLNENPPSPYWEEAALGYDAYSILNTGKDHHGHSFPLVAFESFGDWKPSLYFYVTALSESIFGLNTFAVRLPSALSGIVTVILCYLIVIRIFIKDKQAQSLALISSLLLAIAPWHVLISRVGFETNLGFFLSTLGFYLFITFIQSKATKSIYLIIGASIVWGLSLYAYHSNRVFIPILLAYLIVRYRKILWSRKKSFLLSCLILIIFALPIGLKMNSPEIRQRFAETSALTSLEPVLLSNEVIAEDGGVRLAKLVHHRYWNYGKLIIENYISHFNWDFLFLNGDENRRHSMGLVGQLYWIYAPFLILGILYTIKNKEKKLISILLFSLLAVVPAAITTASPHGLRSLPMVMGLCIYTGYGFIQSYLNLSKYKIKSLAFASIFSLILLFHVTQFWHYYWNTYRLDYAREWQYGYEELIQYLNSVKQNYDQILIARDYGRPAMYYWFYTKTDPRLVQQWNLNAAKDQGEFLQFENIYFGIEPKSFGSQLRVMSNLLETSNSIYQVRDLKGGAIFTLYENN